MEGHVGCAEKATDVDDTLLIRRRAHARARAPVRPNAERNSYIFFCSEIAGNQFSQLTEIEAR